MNKAYTSTLKAFSPLVGIILFVICFYSYYDLLGFTSSDSMNLTTDLGAREFLLRTIWGLSLVVLVVVSISSILLALLTISSALSETAPLHWSITFILLIVFTAPFIFIDLGGAAMGVVISNVENSSSLPFNNILESAVILSNAAIVFIVSATIAIIRSTTRCRSVESIARAFYFWSINLLLSSILLVVGSLQMYFFQEWAAHIGNFSHDVVLAFAISGSVIYTMVLILIFSPSIIVLESFARAIMEIELGSVSRKKRVKWREENSLYRSPLKIFGSYALMGAPFLFGTIADLLLTGVLH